MATTIFVDHKLDIGGGQHLWLDGNSKITAGNGTFAEPVANAFSLPSGKYDGACPYATPACLASCYTLGLKKHAPALAEKYEHNLQLIANLVLYNHSTWNRSITAIARYAQETCPAGFRWHVSGDVFNRPYAIWIAEVCKAAPDVPFWIYTRSFPYLAPLVGIPNLVVNLSADRDNYDEAIKASIEYNCLRICYMSTRDGYVPDGLHKTDVIFPDYNLRGRDLDDPTTAPWWQGLTQIQRRSVCPPDMFGQSEKLRCGPCKKCLVKP